MHPKICVVFCALALLCFAFPAWATQENEGVKKVNESVNSDDLAEEKDPPGEDDASFVDEITVVSASRRRQRIVEAPAAVSVIPAEQIARESSHGQLPKLLEFTPGAEVTQSGLYDFNFNTRGFNSSANRRILVLIDGRNPATSFSSAMEWATLALPLDSYESVEMVRGPGAALYGADAFNGVISITTKAPAQDLGGRITLTGGDLDTFRFDGSYGKLLGNGWAARLTGSYLDSGDLSRSRIDLNGNGVADVGTEVEYEGLSLDAIPLPSDRNEGIWGTLRLDKSSDRGHSLSMELGSADFASGGTIIGGIGRVQFADIKRPYLRLSYSSPHWDFLVHGSRRETFDALSLSSGGPLIVYEEVAHAELQTHRPFAGDRGRIIGGASIGLDKFDSTNADGAQTLLFETIDVETSAFFGQVEYDFNDKLRGVFSARYDASDLHAGHFSPRAALVFAPAPRHTFRATYGEAFQSPNPPEIHLGLSVAPDLSIAPLQMAEEAWCTPFGVECGLDAVPVMALGNLDMKSEEVRTFEVGYRGLLGDKVFVNVDYYNNRMLNFITDLVSAVNPTLGVLNPSYGPFEAPEGIPDSEAAALESFLLSIFPNMTNHPLNQRAVLKAVTYTNFGKVESQGVELGLTAMLNDELRLSASLNWFDFDINEQLEQDPLQANAPEIQYSLGLSWIRDRYDFSFKYRHVDAFEWAAGSLKGPIPAYDIVDLVAGYRVNDRLSIGLNVANLFDERHYQIFGGDVLQRRALAYLTWRW